MSLVELIVSTVILDIASSAIKADVVERLLLKLAADGHIGEADVPTLSAGVMRRESLRSTGIGLGVAIPHTRHGSISRPIGVLGLCRNPVNFDSIEGNRPISSPCCSRRASRMLTGTECPTSAVSCSDSSATGSFSGD